MQASLESLSPEAAAYLAAAEWLDEVDRPLPDGVLSPEDWGWTDQLRQPEQRKGGG